jgi:hypothetical protein
LPGVVRQLAAFRKKLESKKQAKNTINETILEYEFEIREADRVSLFKYEPLR